MAEVTAKYFIGSDPTEYESKEDAERHIPSGFSLDGWGPSENSDLNGCEGVKVEVGSGDDKIVYEGFEFDERSIRNGHLYETWKYLNDDETIGIRISFYGEEVTVSDVSEWQDYRKFDFSINLNGSTTEADGKAIESDVASEEIPLEDGRSAVVTAKFIPSASRKNFYAIISEKEIAQKFNYEFWYYGPTTDNTYGKVRIVSKRGTVDGGTVVEAPTEVDKFWGDVTWDRESYTIDGNLSEEGTSEKEIDVYWNDSDGQEDSITLKWGHKYPFIEIPDGLNPPGADQIISGIYLCKRRKGSEDAWVDVCRTNDGYGNGIGVVEQTVLATGKENETVLEFSFQARWTERIEHPVKTLDDLRSMAGALPMQFCQDPFAKYDIPFSSTDGSVSIRTGFTEDFSKKLDEGGRVITRQMMNTLGNLGTQAQFFEQCGGIWTFRPEVSDAIGGYPEDAMLQFFDEEQNALRTVMSCKDNNKDNFIANKGFIDGKSWKFVDDNPEVGINVDYSDFKDISNDIFVETGVPDLYEVPYDSFLQIFALGSLDCESMKRNEDVEYVNVHIGYDEKTDPDTGEVTKEEVYEKVNGLYTTYMTGNSYLDVYPKNSMTFGSIQIGGYNPYEWWVVYPAKNLAHIMEICPLSPLSGGIMLSKGDKIRIRNVVRAEMSPPLESKYGKVVRDYYYDDKVLKRTFHYRFANLYRRGFSL